MYGAGTWSTTVSESWSRATIETLLATMRRVERELPRPDVTDIICDSEGYRRLRGCLPEDLSGGAFSYLTGIPVYTRMTFLEACLLAERLEADGRRPALLVLESDATPDTPVIVTAPE